MTVRTVERRPPKQAPGKEIAAAIRRSPVWFKAEQLNAGDFSGFATKELFRVPANTFVTDIIVNISQAFTASVTITIGDGSDVDRFFDSATIAPQTAAWKSMKQDTQPGSGGYIYTSGDTIDLVLAGATPTAGTIDVWLAYILDADELGLGTGQ